MKETREHLSRTKSGIIRIKGPGLAKTKPYQLNFRRKQKPSLTTPKKR